MRVRARGLLTLPLSAGVDANRAHKDAFAYAHKTVFGVDVSIDAANHHGCTDAMVSERTLATVGISAEDAQAAWPRVSEAMVEYFETLSPEQTRLGLELLPGVEELLTALSQREEVRVGLVTGNLQRACLSASAAGLRLRQA